MTRYRAPKLTALVALLTLPLALAGCPSAGDDPGGNGNENPPTSGGKLVAFKSTDEWINYFRTQARRNASGRGVRNFLFGTDSVATNTAGGSLEAAAPSQDDAGSADADAFSTTNLQEAGVDEADIVKSDGVNFYIGKGRSLRIVRANPRAELAEIGRIDFEESISDLYLRDGKVIVLSQKYAEYGPGEIYLTIWPPYFTGGTTIVREISVADPANPTQTREAELEGLLVNSRLTAGRLILVLSISPRLPAELTSQSVDRIELGDVMPQVRTSAGATDLVPWDRWLYPESPDGYMMTAVATLDAANVETVLNSVAILAQPGTVYSSTEALYVTDLDYDWLGGERSNVTVHKFAFDDNGAAQYVASGEVPGRLLNQFSLGEYEGALRVATHIPARFDGAVPFATDGGDVAVSNDGSTAQASAAPPQPSNAVYVLQQNGDSLDITGRIENIAPGERLYSARFLAKRGFLVTFEQIDPLFALDLTDPAAPAIVGELKIPGFSDYLHPIDDTHLIGLGRSTTETPWGAIVADSLQLSLFDVSDLSNPTVVQQIKVGGYGSYSEANYNHKAFTYFADQQVLAIPATLQAEVADPFGNRSFDYLPAFEGIVCFRVDLSGGYTEIGRIPSVQPERSQPYYYYYGGWQRAAFIGESIYAINNLGVRAAPLSDFSATTTVRLAPGGDEYIYGIEGDAGAGIAE